MKQQQQSHTQVGPGTAASEVASSGGPDGNASQGWAKDFLLKICGFDMRSLALLRIGVCTGYLWELLRHWKYLEAYCTDNGLLSRTSIFEGSAGGWSIYLTTGHLEGIQLLYLFHMAAVVALLIGYRTKWASLLCFIFAYSYQHRFPAIPGWETEVRNLFLIGTMLPWGERFAWDARNQQDSPNTVTDFVATPATIAWRVQVALVYLASGLAKTGPGWAEGTAVEVSLASDGYSTPIGLWLLSLLKQSPQSLPALNFGVPLLEIFAPLLLLSPWPRIQLLGAILLALMHAAFGVCLHIGAFSLMCCLCLLGFLPSEFWSKLKAGSGKPDQDFGGWRLAIFPSIACSWICLSMLASALDNLPEFKGKLHEPTRHPWVATGTEQAWTMFVPPPFEGGWHVIRGKTLRGRWVDLLWADGRLASEDRPEWVWETYPGVRGYLFLGNHARTADPTRATIHQSIARYYKCHWEGLHTESPDRLSEVEIIFHLRKYNPGTGFGASERNLVYSEHFQ